MIASSAAQALMATDSLALDTASVRRAIATVFSNPDYERSLRTSLWSNLMEWLGAVASRLFGAVGDAPALRWAVILAAALIVTAFVAHLVYGTSTRGGSLPFQRGRGSASAVDPLALARSAAGEGRFLDAAHYLYLAILEELRRTDRLTLDPSKTLGDYRRELAARSSRALHPYREFARAYEPMVWGGHECDASSYHRLEQLASALMRDAVRPPVAD